MTGPTNPLRELREALEPFAELAAELRPEIADDEFVTGGFGDDPAGVTTGDFRRAARAARALALIDALEGVSEDGIEAVAAELYDRIYHPLPPRRPFTEISDVAQAKWREIAAPLIAAYLSHLKEPRND